MLLQNKINYKVQLVPSCSVKWLQYKASHQFLLLESSQLSSPPLECENSMLTIISWLLNVWSVLEVTQKRPGSYHLHMENMQGKYSITTIGHKESNKNWTFEDCDRIWIHWMWKIMEDLVIFSNSFFGKFCMRGSTSGIAFRSIFLCVVLARKQIPLLHFLFSPFGFGHALMYVVLLNLHYVALFLFLSHSVGYLAREAQFNIY